MEPAVAVCIHTPFLCLQQSWWRRAIRRALWDNGQKDPRRISTLPLFSPFIILFIFSIGQSDALHCDSLSIHCTKFEVKLFSM